MDKSTTLSLGLSIFIKGNTVVIVTSMETILDPMHETDKMLDATKTKSNASLCQHPLGELFYHVPDILFNKIVEVLIVHLSSFNEMQMFPPDVEANNIQEKVDTLKRHDGHWSNFWLSKCCGILTNVGVNDFYDGI